MALMLESANEMALALAEKTSGSVKKFVELMNQRQLSLAVRTPILIIQMVFRMRRIIPPQVI